MTDTKTSEAIFEIGGVRPFAHLEFAKGFVTFDTGNGMSSSPNPRYLEQHADIQTLLSRSGVLAMPSLDHHKRPPLPNHLFPTPSSHTLIPTLRSPPDHFLEVTLRSTERSHRLLPASLSGPGRTMQVWKGKSDLFLRLLVRKRYIFGISRRRARTRRSGLSSRVIVSR